MKYLTNDWPTVVVELIKALPWWPAVVLVVFLLLRKPIADLIPYIEEFRFRELSMKFRQRLTMAEDQAAVAQLPPPPIPSGPPSVKPLPEPLLSLPDYLYQLTAISPAAAILEAWARIEAEMRRRLAAAELPQGRTGIDLTRELVKAGILPQDARPILEDLRTLRNLVAHARRLDLAPDEGLRYLELGNRLLAAMNRGSQSDADGRAPNQ
jgi:hypothetical protein